ncbi:phosphatase PAP2 family protein [Thiorhodococcus fuscus]|uniref:undecaprenyl-diphosphate phosphatase n=1 Tax=Thiorhodococcus fuscus TaxID=527200 RepID=A0ABW4Y5Y4_9GAMM
MSRTSEPRSGASDWLIRWAMVSALVAMTIVLICGYHGGFIRLNAIAAGYPDWVWESLTSFGNERVLAALALLFSLRYPRLFWSLLVSALIAALYSRGLKDLLDLPRPPAMLEEGVFHLIGPVHSRASFPSGHSVAAAVFFSVLIWHARTWPWRLLATLFVVAVGFSRVAVGVHWPVDVAAGLMGGALAAWLGCRIAQHWPGPAENVVLHLAVVTLLAVLALSLLYDPGQYPNAAPMLRTLGLVAFLSVMIQYLLLPWRSLHTLDRDV